MELKELYQEIILDHGKNPRNKGKCLSLIHISEPTRPLYISYAVFCLKKKWVDDLPPYQGGGGMINEVKKEGITFADAYTKFEAGTMQTAEVVAFAESLNFIEDLGIKNIASHENEISQYGLEKFRKNNSVNIIGDPKKEGQFYVLL